MALSGAAKEGYELMEINGRPVLFVNMRLNRGTVPAGIFCYDVWDSDALDGNMAEIKAVVIVSHWGIIPCKDSFSVDECGNYYPKDWGCLGKDMSLEKFQKTDREQLTTYLLPEAP